MKGYFGPIFAILAKDVLLELRTKDILVSVVVFALLVIVIFNFALNPTPNTVAMVAPGILWVAFTFGGVLGLNRSFALEKERGNLRGLMLAPIGRDAVYFGKFLGNFLFMVIVEAVIYPVFAVLFNLPLLVPGFIPVALLATLGIAAVGTMFSAMAVNTRSREVMLPVLFFPVVVPIIVAAVEATGVLIRGDASADLTRWVPFMAVFDAIFLVVCPAAFAMIIEE
ncbi:MAG: heme exporter protein CcmB [SAR202 cluster bacterium]|nr:heme exporter protein CcmB [SAR202 cluster bacterium]